LNGDAPNAPDTVNMRASEFLVYQSVYYFRQAIQIVQREPKMQYLTARTMFITAPIGACSAPNTTALPISPQRF